MPVSATMPNMLSSVTSKPNSQCPITAPTRPNGITIITMTGWT